MSPGYSLGGWQSSQISVDQSWSQTLPVLLRAFSRSTNPKSHDAIMNRPPVHRPAATLKWPNSTRFAKKSTMAADSPEFIDPAEDCPWCSRREIFGRFGYEPLPPSELDDRQLPGRLWELLYAAAARRFFLCSTNHLSDRELY